jgi:hypothetical protein
LRFAGWVATGLPAASQGRLLNDTLPSSTS